MCFVEYNWTANVWQFRIGDRFTDFQGTRSWPDLSEVKSFFKAKNCALRKTDSRTYAVEARDTRRWGLGTELGAKVKTGRGQDEQG